MHNPVIALTWRCWRLTRRWYLMILAIAIALHMAIMHIPSSNMTAQFESRFREELALAAFMLNMVLAVFTTLYAITVGGKAGFPLRFEYRLPVSTSLLVTVPLVYLSAACASLYAVPVLIGRLLYGIPFPIGAGVMFIVVIVAALAAASWSAIGTSARTAAVIIGCAFLLEVMGRMTPFKSFRINFSAAHPRPKEGIFDPDSIAFTGSNYCVLLLLCAVMLGFLIYSVGLQRRGESWRLRGLPLFARRESVAGSPGKSATARRTLIDRISDVFTIPSPLSSPWLAELWLEWKRNGMPILALSIVLALALPPVLWGAHYLEWTGMAYVAWIPTAAVFFIGIGLAFFSRRTASGGYMNDFEASRGLSTLQLAGAQYLMAGIATFVGVVMNAISLGLSLPLLTEAGFIITKAQELAAGFGAAALLWQAATVVMLGVMYFAMVALLVCVHACSVFWGRKVVYGTVAFIFYCLLYTFRLVQQQVEEARIARARALSPQVTMAEGWRTTLESVQHHMWAFAAAVLLLTLVIAGRVQYLRLLTLRTGIASLVTWLVFLACAVIALQSWDIKLQYQAPELQAFNAALLTLPLMFFLLTAWCYDKLRHR